MLNLAEASEAYTLWKMRLKILMIYRQCKQEFKAKKTRTINWHFLLQLNWKLLKV